jgi:hypothetical protein
MAFTATPCPMPALEMLIAEMLAIHFCSDQDETIAVLQELDEVNRRMAGGQGIRRPRRPVFKVNPWRIAGHESAGRLRRTICGTEYLFAHALDPIPQNVPPMERLAQNGAGRSWWARQPTGGANRRRDPPLRR